MRVGVLALQGGFAKHIEIFKILNVDTLEIRLPKELNEIDALVLPGGESTTNIKLMNSGELYTAIKRFSDIKPVFGTCAGSILMGREASNFPYKTLNLLDVFVERNAYGTQVDSFIDHFNFLGKEIEAMFIRAPKFTDIGKTVEILAFHHENPVIVRNHQHLMVTCHPELIQTTDIHRYFVENFIRL